MEVFKSYIYTFNCFHRLIKWSSCQRVKELLFMVQKSQGQPPGRCKINYLSLNWFSRRISEPSAGMVQLVFLCLECPVLQLVAVPQQVFNSSPCDHWFFGCPLLFEHFAWSAIFEILFGKQIHTLTCQIQQTENWTLLSQFWRPFPRMTSASISTKLPWD